MAPFESIDTERLTMRVPALGDFADSASMWGNPEVTRHIGERRPCTEEEVWARLHRYVGHWALLGFGFWTVREKATGAFVGEVGWASFRRAMDPPLGDTPEIGWVLSPAAHGRGYATEAARAALAWADARFGSGRRVCIIAPDNLRSIRVAEKCGFCERARATYKGNPAVVLER
jgi:RimJ/RimL family protein N-acetyltransferase